MKMLKDIRREDFTSSILHQHRQLHQFNLPSPTINMFLDLSKRAIALTWSETVPTTDFVCGASTAPSNKFAFAVGVGLCCNRFDGDSKTSKDMLSSMCKISPAALAAMVSSGSSNGTSATNTTSAINATSAMNEASGVNGTSATNGTSTSNATSSSNTTDASAKGDPAYYTNEVVTGLWQKCLKDLKVYEDESSCGDSSAVKKSAALGLHIGRAGTLAVVASAALAVLTL
jgi:hypothetical protein